MDAPQSLLSNCRVFSNVSNVEKVVNRRPISCVLILMVEPDYLSGFLERKRCKLRMNRVGKTKGADPFSSAFG